MNKENLEMLWDTLTPKLYGYLVNTLRDRNLADDILQATWLKALEALPRFSDRGFGFSAWLFAIARNECRQHWRKGDREIPFDENVHDTKEADFKTEDKILVDQILMRLSDNDRELIRLRFIADLSLNDIAKLFKINPITARVRMHRALSTARSLFIKQQ